MSEALTAAVVGKKVLLRVIGPIVLYDFSSGETKNLPPGDYGAAWVENPYPGKQAPVLLLDDSDLGGEKDYWPHPIANNLVTLTEP